VTKPANDGIFGSDLWEQALEKYARATHLTVRLFDENERAVFGPVHPTPLFRLFAEAGYDPGIFIECAHRCIAQTDRRPAVLVSQFHGLAVVGASLVLDGPTVGAAVGGYALVDFSQASDVRQLAKQSGIAFDRLWAIVRKQPPVPQLRLIVHGELLQVLGDSLLREHHRARHLRQLAETLERRVSEEIATREQAQKQLAHAQRMDALGQLAGGIAHDFNNVIQAVQGGAALIERRSGDAERVRGLARRITEASDRGAAVTQRLLAFSRRGDLRAEPVDAVSMLAEMREILSHTLGDGVKVRVETGPGLPLLLVDKAQLETVLINLATNARDAMQNLGTLTLSAAKELAPDSKAPIPLKPGAYLRLCATDTGAGMTAEVLAHASEPFFTTKTAGQGTGLGLAMARGFAEQSGGGLFIESAPGHGTVVKLWFPVAEGPFLAANARENQAAVGVSGEVRARLLLVDDDAIVRETLAQEMEAEGFAVVPAASGAGALQLLDAGEVIDLIISDLSMPGMDGMSFIQEAQRRRSHLPAILLTGFSATTGIALEAAVSGVLTLLRKPVHGRMLAERVAMLLEREAIARK
jgi:signal transduction histidine kinase/ActR/RegA family two-component response regulator